MAKKGARGKVRAGQVKGRSQTYNPKSRVWVKRDTSSGRFVQVKRSGGSFRSVKRENR